MCVSHCAQLYSLFDCCFDPHSDESSEEGDENGDSSSSSSPGPSSAITPLPSRATIYSSLLALLKRNKETLISRRNTRIAIAAEFNIVDPNQMKELGSMLRSMLDDKQTRSDNNIDEQATHISSTSSTSSDAPFTKERVQAAVDHINATIRSGKMAPPSSSDDEDGDEDDGDEEDGEEDGEESGVEDDDENGDRTVPATMQTRSASRSGTPTPLSESLPDRKRRRRRSRHRASQSVSR